MRRPTAPVVVLEAGAFNAMQTWNDVFEPISTFARVCAYDRPGRGASGAPPAGLDARGAVELLRGVLLRAGESPPYLLVGHSLGGLMAQLFVTMHPEEVAALILVDSSHPAQVRRMPAPPPRPATPAPPTLAPEAVPLAGFIEALEGTRWTFSGPLVVLSRGRWTNGTDNADDRARLAVWMELQRDLATRSPRSEHRVAAESGHYIQTSEPMLVIDAVRRLAAVP